MKNQLDIGRFIRRIFILGTGLVWEEANCKNEAWACSRMQFVTDTKQDVQEVSFVLSINLRADNFWVFINGSSLLRTCTQFEYPSSTLDLLRYYSMWLNRRIHLARQKLMGTKLEIIGISVPARPTLYPHYMAQKQWETHQNTTTVVLSQTPAMRNELNEIISSISMYDPRRVFQHQTNSEETLQAQTKASGKREQGCTPITTARCSWDYTGINISMSPKMGPEGTAHRTWPISTNKVVSWPLAVPPRHPSGPQCLDLPQKAPCSPQPLLDLGNYWDYLCLLTIAFWALRLPTARSLAVVKRLMRGVGPGHL